MSNSEKNVIALPSLETMEAEAAVWLTVLGREHLSEAEIAKFKAWLVQSDRNRTAFNALSSLWEDLAILEALGDIAEASAGASPAAQGLGISRRAFIAAAACVPLAVVVSMAANVYRGRLLRQSGDFATQIGEQRTVSLSDGSAIQLNTNSLVRVKYSEAARCLWLTKGEVYFKVRKDPRRPFSVYAANCAVRAVGTAFTIRLHTDNALEVTVEEGRVALLSESVAAERNRQVGELAAQQTAVFSQRVQRIDQLNGSELNQKLAWRQGVLAYAGVPLCDVVADVSRYTDITIEILDARLRSKPVGGVFRVGEIDALFDSLKLTFGVKVERVNSKLVRLSPST